MKKAPQDPISKLSEQVERGFGVVKDTIESLDSKIEDLRQKIEGRFTQMDAQFSEVHAQLRDINSELGYIHKRLDRLEEIVGGQSGYAKEIDLLMGRMAELEKAIKALRVKVAKAKVA